MKSMNTKRITVFLLVFFFLIAVVPYRMVKNINAAVQRVILLCEKQEYYSCDSFIESTLTQTSQKVELSVNSQEKPIYIVMVPENEDKKNPGVINYCNDSKRQEQFNVILTSVQEHKRVSTLVGTRSLIVEYYQKYKTLLQYVVLANGKNKSFYMGKIKTNIKESRTDKTEIEIISDLFYSDMNGDGFADFSISHLQYAFFRKQWTVLQKENSVSVLMPPAYYTRQYGDGKCASFCYRVDLSHIGYEIEEKLKRNTQIKNIDTLYEQRGSETKNGYSGCDRKPKKQLNRENAYESISNSQFIIGDTTWEKVKVDWNKWGTNEFFKEEIRKKGDTAYFKDSDNDGKIDHANNEIIVETFLDNNVDKFSEHKRIGLFPLTIVEDPNSNFYVWVNRVYSPDIWGGKRETMLVESETAIYKIILDALFSGETIGEAVSNSRKRYIEMFPENRYSRDLWCLTIIVWGPPETTLDDLVANARMDITPKEINDSSEIVIPLKEKEYKFQITNQGDADLNLSFVIDSQELSINPLTATVAPNGSQEITIKLGGLPNIPTIEPLTSPKKKSTQMRINSNCFEKTKVINIKWTGT